MAINKNFKIYLSVIFWINTYAMFANHHSNFHPDPLVQHEYKEKGKVVWII